MNDEPSFGEHGDQSLQSAYGTTPQVWNYDNGCTPGAGIMPSVGAALTNISFDISGALSGWTQALLESVIAPDWAEPLDEPVAEATTAVANGTWTPWLVLVMTVVAVVVLFRSREGHLSGAITATAWALLVLLAVSWVVSYPTESVEAVDGTVRSAVVQIGDGFSEQESSGDTEEERALSSVDQQIGLVVETVQYQTWLKTVFGSADSEVAEKYGPATFIATHFTWDEWETYNEDPDGAGAEMLERKADSFKAIAEAVKDEDPAAYKYFTGSQWGSRLSAGAISVLVMFVVCAFLLVAGLTVLAAFAVIRLLVPFTPALGVVFLLDVARERAIDVFRRVGGVLVMGPAYFVASLVLLRFYGALLTADMPFLLRFAFVLALSVIAWRLLKPASSLTRMRVPGLAQVRRYARARQSGGSEPATAEPQPSTGETAAMPSTSYRPVFTGGSSEPVAAPELMPGTFVDRPEPEIVVVRKRDPDALEAPSGPGAHRRTVLAVSERRGPELTAPARAARIVADGQREAEPTANAPRRRIDRLQPEPRRVNESNLILDDQGNRVFVVYEPAGAGH
ncbi:hypothetical protein HNR19_000290 [Nocardioides thalensis]|uniref:Type IV secretion system protein n=1 Tax=Nocardioides thalensis TaxID=1914755 RepID=A0A853BYM7_9ACTN|nr:hypothetical protein [Nocardioides thalensis]NYI99591.1 hypothetical protein [Nocardioides thalensis]